MNIIVSWKIIKVGLMMVITLKFHPAKGRCLSCISVRPIVKWKKLRCLIKLKSHVREIIYRHFQYEIYTQIVNFVAGTYALRQPQQHYNFQ